MIILKKTISFLLILTIVFLAGCSVIKTGDDSSERKTLQSLGIAYSSGNYTIKTALCTGFITNGSQDIWLSIPIAKRILEGQGIRVTEITNAGFRTVTGNFVGGFNADLTEYIYSAQALNDGAVLYVRLRNESQWQNDANKVVQNNTPFTGYVDVAFTIADP